MNFDEYEKLAMETEADQEVILDRFLNWDRETQLMYIRANNGVRGVSDEAGELNAPLKKMLEYGNEPDKKNMKEEIGDLLWRAAQTAKAFGFTLKEAAEANIRKLHKVRYKNGYSDEAATEENRDRIDEASCMNSADIVEQEWVDDINGKNDEAQEVLAQQVWLMKRWNRLWEAANVVAEMLDGKDRTQALRILENAKAED